MAELKRVERGEPIRAEDYNALVDAVLKLLNDGPEVVAPLAKKDGAIYLGEDLRVRHARATGTISTRVGSQMGSGPAQLYSASSRPDADRGTMATAGQFNAVTVWNDTGGTDPIDPGTWLQVALVDGLWTILTSDCSGYP